METKQDDDKFGEKLPLSIQLSITLGSIAGVLTLLYIVYCIFKYKKGDSEIENEINFSDTADQSITDEIKSLHRKTQKNTTQKITEDESEMEATEDIKPNVQVLSEPEKNTERDFESITEPTKRNERAHDKDYDRIARSCEDSDVNRIFSISQIMIKAMANENFRNIEEFYILENHQVKCFFERHGESFETSDGPHVLRAIAYARIIACQMMLQEKDLYKIGGKLDTTACRLCTRVTDRTDEGHCDCCSSLDCSIDLACAPSNLDRAHCQCCLAFKISLPRDISYDAYIYQADKLRESTNLWLDDQPELMEIRQLNQEAKREFFNKMMASNMPIADIASVIRITNAESCKIILSKLGRRQELSSQVKSDPSEELSWRVNGDNILVLLQMHISHLRTFITKKSSRNPEEDDRFDFSNHLKKQKYVPSL